MKIKDVMTTSPACCLPFDTATRPARIMKDRNIGVVPVIETEENRKVIGVVTDRDLCLDAVAEGLDPSSVQVKQCRIHTRHLGSSSEPVSDWSARHSYSMEPHAGIFPGRAWPFPESRPSRGPPQICR
jgi:hypothetical protein